MYSDPHCSILSQRVGGTFTGILACLDLHHGGPCQNQPPEQSDHMSLPHHAPASDQDIYTPQRHRNSLTGNKQLRGTGVMEKLYDG